MQGVMRGLGVVILVLGLVSFVFGVIFVASVPGANSKLETELARPAGTTVDEVDGLYDRSMESLEALFAADPRSALPGNAYYQAWWAESNTADGMGLIKTNLGILQQTTILSILNILIGIALMMAAVVVLRLGRRLSEVDNSLAALRARVIPEEAPSEKA